MTKLFLHLILSLVMITSAFAKVEGPGSGTGGDLEEDDRPSKSQVEIIIENIQDDLKYVFNYYERFKLFSVRVGPPKSAEELELERLLFQRPAGEDVLAVLEKTNFIPSPTPCVDTNGFHKDGTSESVSTDGVCLNVLRIREKTTSQDVKRKILVLAAHEMVHRMGGDERLARYLGRELNGFLNHREFFSDLIYVKEGFWTQAKEAHAATQLGVSYARTALDPQDATNVRSFQNAACRQVARLNRQNTLSLYEKANGFPLMPGLWPVRADKARLVALISYKISMLDAYCMKDERTSRLKAEFGSDSELTWSELNRRTLGYAGVMPQGPEIIRKPSYGDFKNLALELEDIQSLLERLK